MRHFIVNVRQKKTSPFPLPHCSLLVARCPFLILVTLFCPMSLRKMRIFCKLKTKQKSEIKFRDQTLIKTISWQVESEQFDKFQGKWSSKRSGIMYHLFLFCFCFFLISRKMDGELFRWQKINYLQKGFVWVKNITTTKVRRFNNLIFS